MNTKTHLLEVKRLKTNFYTFEGIARAVDNVSFFLEEGETLGLVGESGCGKSVTALSILRLIPEPPGRIFGGGIFFEGNNRVNGGNGNPLNDGLRCAGGTDGLPGHLAI